MRRRGVLLAPSSHGPPNPRVCWRELWTSLSVFVPAEEGSSLQHDRFRAEQDSFSHHSNILESPNLLASLPSQSQKEGFFPKLGKDTTLGLQMFATEEPMFQACQLPIVWEERLSLRSPKSIRKWPRTGFLHLCEGAGRRRKGQKVPLIAQEQIPWA